MDFSINQRALAMVEEEILPHQEQLQVRAYTLANGATKAEGDGKAAKYAVWAESLKG